MYILAFFTDSGVPKTGLSPTINIREVPTGILVISGSNMTGFDDGSYYYDYTNYDSEKDYAVICDGGSSLANTERYKFAGNENYIDDIENMFDNNVVLSGIQTDLKRALGLMHENIYIDETIYDAHGNLSDARVRIYSNSGSVGTANNIIGTYEITSLSSETGKFDYWKQVVI
jgi:hypothetical protein